MSGLWPTIPGSSGSLKIGDYAHSLCLQPVDGGAFYGVFFERPHADGMYDLIGQNAAFAYSAGVICLPAYGEYQHGMIREGVGGIGGRKAGCGFT